MRLIALRVKFSGASSSYQSYLTKQTGYRNKKIVAAGLVGRYRMEPIGGIVSNYGN